MRAGIGLLGLLIVAAIIFWISFGPMGKAQNGYVGQVLKSGQEGREQASQISGRDESGVPASDTIKVEAVGPEGHVRRLKVVSLVPGGAFEKAYQLQVGDEISDIGGLGVDMNDDFGMAQARLFESIQRNEVLTVTRNGQKLTLTPDTALSHFHPEAFGQPGVRPLPQAIPTH